MARRDLSQRDISDYATGELDSVIRRQSAAQAEAVPTVTAEQAMREARVLEHQSARDVTRVLFISRNTELLNPTKQSLDGYLHVSEMFDEVHILILRQGIAPRQPVLRPHKNVYLYIVSTTYWWQLPHAAMNMIENQLVFAAGLRPDLIVARDPYESAITAWWVAGRYHRPLQLHILQNEFYPSLFKILIKGQWRQALARFTVARFPSIRGATDVIMKQLETLAPTAERAKLPQLNPYDAVTQLAATVDLKRTYPDAVFNLLYVGSRTNSDAMMAAISAARYVLRNPKVNLIFAGTGKVSGECRQFVKQIGLERQVIFLKATTDPIPYLKAADLLLVTATDSESDEIVLQGAAARIPLVATRTEQRTDWFEHRESAYLCAQGDPQALSDGVYELAGDHELRHQLAEQANDEVAAMFHHDLATYRQQYQRTIEAAMFVEPTEETE